jgi:hypothetical protein
MKQKPRTKRRDSLEDAARVQRIFKKLAKSSTMGKSRSKRFVQLSRNLSNTFRHVCPDVNSKLRGKTIGLLLDVFDYSYKIEKDVQKLAHLTHPRDVQTLRSYLTDMQLLSLQGQQRYIAELRRHIPILLRSMKKGNGTQSGKRGLVDEISAMLGAEH